jgi:hypothetical protein
VEVFVMSRSGGRVSIVSGPVDWTAPDGFVFFGQQVTISAPAATAADPLVIAFRLDASLIPQGHRRQTIEVFKNGVLVSPCTGDAGVAEPDPCVSGRTALHGGTVLIEVLTSTASEWNFAVAVPSTPHPPSPPRSTFDPERRARGPNPNPIAGSGEPSNNSQAQTMTAILLLVSAIGGATIAGSVALWKRRATVRAERFRWK